MQPLRMRRTSNGTATSSEQHAAEATTGTAARPAAAAPRPAAAAAAPRPAAPPPSAASFIPARIAATPPTTYRQTAAHRASATPAPDQAHPAAVPDTRAVVSIQRRWRGRSQQLQFAIRLQLSRVSRSSADTALAGGLDSVGALVTSACGESIWKRALHNAPEAWEEPQMIEAMSDLLRDPARSSLVWLLAQPTKHERALLMLYASRAPTAQPSEPLPARMLVHGTLHLFLSHAVGLKAMDNNGKSDPYVKFSLAGKEVKSKTISKNLNPRWSEVFTFKGVLKDLTAAPLQLRCKDKDTFSSDKLGDASIDLRGLARTDMVELQAQLSTQGTVYLRAAWQADGKPPPPGSLTADVPAASSPLSSAPSTPIAAATYWVATVTSCVPPQMVGESAPDESALHAWLRSGERLCQLVNVLQPGSVGRIAKSEMPFPQMENIETYLRACLQLGVPQQDLFTTPDLFNAKNMGAVVRNLHSLGRVAQRLESFPGPHLGVKLSTKVEKRFTVLKSAVGVTSQLQRVLQSRLSPDVVESAAKSAAGVTSEPGLGLSVLQARQSPATVAEKKTAAAEPAAAAAEEAAAAEAATAARAEAEAAAAEKAAAEEKAAEKAVAEKAAAENVLAEAAAAEAAAAEKAAAEKAATEKAAADKAAAERVAAAEAAAEAAEAAAEAAAKAAAEAAKAEAKEAEAQLAAEAAAVTKLQAIQRGKLARREANDAKKALVAAKDVADAERLRAELVAAESRAREAEEAAREATAASEKADEAEKAAAKKAAAEKSAAEKAAAEKAAAEAAAAEATATEKAAAEKAAAEAATAEAATAENAAAEAATAENAAVASEPAAAGSVSADVPATPTANLAADALTSPSSATGGGSTSYVFESGKPIGLQLADDISGAVVVVAVVDGSLAHEKGITIGMTLLAVNGQSVAAMKKDDALDLVRSTPAGAARVLALSNERLTEAEPRRNFRKERDEAQGLKVKAAKAKVDAIAAGLAGGASESSSSSSLGESPSSTVAMSAQAEPDDQHRPPPPAGSTPPGKAGKTATSKLSFGFGRRK